MVIMVSSPPDGGRCSARHHLDTCGLSLTPPSLLLLLLPPLSYLDSLIVSDNDVFRHSGDTKERLILPLTGWGSGFTVEVEGPGELPPVITVSSPI